MHASFLSRGAYLLMAFLLAAPFAASAAGMPQSAPAKIDAGHSYASFWVGGQGEAAPPVNVAVAQIAGTATLYSAKHANSLLSIAIVPGGDGSDLLSPEGTLREGVIARLLHYTSLSFRTTHARVRRDGMLEFAGELTVTHVTREQIPNAWNSATNTPSYTDPVITSATRTVTFVLTNPHAAFIENQRKQGHAFLASAIVTSAAFPELSAALLDSSWPIVAQDEHCEFPAGVAGTRDYTGAVCTGKAVSTTNVPQAPVSFGRDYSGRPRVQADLSGPVTILLYVKFNPPVY